MTAFLIVLAVAAEAYLLGSVDTGILVSKYLYHDDVRTHGSGAAIMGGMVISMHRSNIQRIRDGKEYRFGQKHKSN